MLNSIRSRITYSNVMATLALFVALGGTASAAVIITSNDQVGADTISGHAPPSGAHSNIIAGSVTTDDLADNTVRTAKIANGHVTTADLASSAVTSAKISDGQVQSADLADSAVTSSKIANGSVGNVDIGYAAVNGDKVLNSSLTGADVLNRGLSDADIGSAAQVNGADLPPVGAHSCIALQLNFGGWTQVGELVIAQARDGQLATSGLFITPLVVVTAGSASGRICNLSDATIDAAAEDILAWSIRQ